MSFKRTCLMPASLSAVHSCASDRKPPSFRQQVLNITNTISRVFHESQVHRVFEININKVLFFEIISTPSLWYFSECKQKKRSCVLDLNDALLRLYNYHPRIEMKKTKKLCYKLYHQLLKQKFSREISSLCFRAHQFGNHHKKVKYLKSDNTPLIKIVANKKNTQICTNFKTNYFLMLLLLYKKNICVIGWRPPKWLQGTIGRYKKFATEIGKSENKNKQTNK